MVSSRAVLLLGLLGSLVMNQGCSSFWFELQPHRLNRLNRGPAPSLDPEFSQRNSNRQPQLVKSHSNRSDANISVNTTDVVSVRSQSPDLIP